jgi:hypothetical protein
MQVKSSFYEASSHIFTQMPSSFYISKVSLTLLWISPGAKGHFPSITPFGLKML